MKNLRLNYLLAFIIPPLAVWRASEDEYLFIKNIILTAIFGCGNIVLIFVHPFYPLTLLGFLPILHAFRIVKSSRKNIDLKKKEVIKDGILVEEGEEKREENVPFGELPDWMGKKRSETDNK